MTLRTSFPEAGSVHKQNLSRAQPSSDTSHPKGEGKGCGATAPIGAVFACKILSPPSGPSFPWALRSAPTPLGTENELPVTDDGSSSFSLGCEAKEAERPPPSRRGGPAERLC
eukprot:1723698-Pyramimonas_sp.AAC.1